MYPDEQRIDFDNQVKVQYDFIIVGGGSAGAVVASRLSENPAWKVLLLEAGTDESSASDVPVFANFLQQGSFDWQYRLEPQPGRACLGLEDGRCNWPRGKVLGGSSVLNYMLYVRGNKGDYDGWEKLGNPGWGYESVLPYFRKSEDNKNPYLAKDTRHHGTGGYLTVQEPPWKTPVAVSFVEAGVELGYENRDCNGERQTGFMLPQATMRRGTRCSTAKAFLRPAGERHNLDILLESHVMKVIIDPHSRKTKGVQFMRKGKVFSTYARKEVVLCGGTINTPQILMLSGIGPAQHLSSLGVPVLANLAVGHNLMDHYGTFALVGTLEQKVTLNADRLLPLALPAILEYINNDAGPLTLLGGVEGLAWINTKYANRSADRPDIQLHFSPGHLASESGTVQAIHGVTDRMYNTLYSPLEGRDIFSFLVLLTRPKSKGHIKLASRNPFEKPIIQAGYFTEPEDIKVLVEGMKFCLRLVKTQAFKKYGGKIWSGRKMPGCEQYKLWSDNYLACIARQYTNTGYHHVGTAKMGPAADSEAVVDHRLRVHSIKGLRVVDASIMPTVPSGNTNAPAIMVGEKGSDLIKQDWGFYK